MQEYSKKLTRKIEWGFCLALVVNGRLFFSQESVKFSAV